MFKRTELIRWTITQALIIVAVLGLLVVMATAGLTMIAIDDYQSQAAATAVSPKVEVIPDLRLE